MDLIKYIRFFIESSLIFYMGLLALFIPMSNDKLMTLYIIFGIFIYELIYSIISYRNKCLFSWVKDNHWDLSAWISLISVLIGFLISKLKISYFSNIINIISIGLGLDDPDLIDVNNKDIVICTFTLSILGGIIGSVFIKPRYKEIIPDIYEGDRNIYKLPVISLMLFLYIIFLSIFKIFYVGYEENILERNFIDSNIFQILFLSFCVSYSLIIYQMTFSKFYLILKMGR